jgi:hypothetical protein
LTGAQLVIEALLGGGGEEEQGSEQGPQQEGAPVASCWGSAPSCPTFQLLQCALPFLISASRGAGAVLLLFSVLNSMDKALKR